MPTDREPSVTIVAHLPPDVRPTAGAVLRARVEDMSIADRRPSVIGSGSVRLDSAPEDDLVVITVRVQEQDVDMRASYGVFVHLDLTGSGEIDAGDAITTRSYPVLTQGNPSRAEVELHRVGGATPR
jgi:putative lipoprotein